MRSVPRHSRTTVEVLFVLSLALLGVTQSVHLIHREWFRRDGPGGGPTIGTLTQKIATVRRKLANGYAWHFVESGDAFYHRESLQTGPESTAIVVLASGGRAEINENSLVEFDGSAEHQLHLLEGTLVLTQGEQETSFTMRPDGRLVSQDLKLQAISPKPGEQLFVHSKEKKKLAFRWLAKNPVLRSGLLEIST